MRPTEHDHNATDKAIAGDRRIAAAIESARRGDADGWTTLFDRFYPDVFRYAFARLADRATAEDIAQDVFVAAVRAIHSLRDTDAVVVQAWLLRICRNLVVDHTRRRRDIPTADQDLATVTPDPTAIIDRGIGGEALRSALESLTDDQREILIRRFVLDQSLGQVARATDRTEGAVKSLQHRGLAALARVLGSRNIA